MAMGNFGDVKAVGGKVSEARIFSRPAVRLYFTMLDGIVIILLCSAGKNDQKTVIAKAEQLPLNCLKRYAMKLKNFDSLDYLQNEEVCREALIAAYEEDPGDGSLTIYRGIPHPMRSVG